MDGHVCDVAGRAICKLFAACISECRRISSFLGFRRVDEWIGHNKFRRRDDKAVVRMRLLPEEKWIGHPPHIMRSGSAESDTRMNCISVA